MGACMRDTIFLPITYDDAILILRNINPDRGDVWQLMKRELNQLVWDHTKDMMYDLEQSKADVWAAAFPDERKPLVNAPGWDSAKLEELAYAIQKWLRDHGMWIDVYLYYDGKRMGTSGIVNGKEEFRYNDEPFIEEGCDPRDYFEYVANPHILSLSFEGPLYEVLNGYCAGATKLEREFQDLFRRRGLYFELGRAWNATAYEV